MPHERALQYRNYAEELRTIAATKTMTSDRDALLRAADTYDRMAGSLEAASKPKKGQ